MRDLVYKAKWPPVKTEQLISVDFNRKSDGAPRLSRRGRRAFPLYNVRLSAAECLGVLQLW